MTSPLQNFLSQVDYNGRTRLHQAVLRGDAIQVTKLLEVNADVNARDNNSRTPLHLAAFEGKKNIALRLIDSNADVYATDNKGYTAYDLALHENRRFTLTTLINKIVDLNPEKQEALTEHQLAMREEDGYTALHRAVLNNNNTEVLKLIERNANVNARDGKGLTPLHHAIRKSNSFMISVLATGLGDVIPGLDLSDTNLGSKTTFEYKKTSIKDSLDLAIKKPGDLESNKSPKANLSLKNISGNTVLHYAAFAGDLNLVKYFVKQEPDLINILNNSKQSACDLALGKRKPEYLEVVKFLQSKVVVEPKEDGYTALHRVEPKEDGYTALHRAVLNNNNTEVLKLIERNANVNARDINGRTPLHHATRKSNSFMISVLAKGLGDVIPGLDLSGTNLGSKTTLEYKKTSIKDSLDLAIKKPEDLDKVDLSLKDIRGNTVLHYAAFAGDLNMVKYFVKQEPDLINILNNSKQSACDLALRKTEPEYLKVAEFLLSEELESETELGDKVEESETELGDKVEESETELDDKVVESETELDDKVVESETELDDKVVESETEPSLYLRAKSVITHPRVVMPLLTTITLATAAFSLYSECADHPWEQDRDDGIFSRLTGQTETTFEECVEKTASYYLSRVL
ncbi:MAG: hypothetical protein S4CHLAM7_13170 [Chlamydiae bacterium]|nr:hypothetical protein [Chlamydiota bacterium]